MLASELPYWDACLDCIVCSAARFIGDIYPNSTTSPALYYMHDNLHCVPLKQRIEYWSVSLSLPARSHSCLLLPHPPQCLGFMLPPLDWTTSHLHQAELCLLGGKPLHLEWLTLSQGFFFHLKMVLSGRAWVGRASNESPWRWGRQKLG